MLHVILIIVLLFVGIVGLQKKRIQISKKRVITGSAVMALSWFYIVMAAALLLFGLKLTLVGVIALVTLIIVFSAKGENVTAAAAGDAAPATQTPPVREGEIK